MPLKIEIIGNHSWPISGVFGKTETFGASFFDCDTGNRYRVAASLNLNGLVSIGSRDEDRAHVYEQGKPMPTWSRLGWIAVTGGILILKLGDYSAPQKASLCPQKLAELCNNR